ncbi:hypothetical protein [Niabella hirudinis]|uniref:hypothetical protein n=1 Tax=Niabella hirudinis TaxID=1285929 RepID=UPI003EBB3FF2
MGYNEPVTGYQNTTVTITSNVVDRSNATITIVASKVFHLSCRPDGDPIVSG